MSNTSHVFLCVDLNIHACEQLILIQEQLGQIITEANASPQWVLPEHLHLSLKTLGPIDRGMLRPLQDTLRNALSSIPPFKFTAQNIRAFPSGQAPRILYAQITQGEAPLLQLRDAVEDALDTLGLPRDTKPFKAHITLGRVRTPSLPIDLNDVLHALSDLPLGANEVRDVAVMQSHLTPKGAQYQILGRAHLQHATKH